MIVNNTFNQKKYMKSNWIIFIKTSLKNAKQWNIIQKRQLIIYIKSKKIFQHSSHSDHSFRIEKLKALNKEIQKREKDIYDALKKDLSKSGFESMTSEILLVEKEISKMIRMLPLWNRTHRAKSSLINFPSKDYILPEPYGNTLIISPWNYPFQLAITPLVGAVAAGNTVVLKPSEFAIHTGNLIKSIIKLFLTGTTLPWLREVHQLQHCY